MADKTVASHGKDRGPASRSRADSGLSYASPMARVLIAFLWLSLSVLSACAKDDEDYIDEFVAAVTGDVTSERVDHVFNTYVDPDVEPVDVRVLEHNRLYGAGEGADMRKKAQEKLSRLNGSSLKILRRKVDIKDDRAYVDLQLFSREAMGNVRYDLRKHDKRWLLSKVAVNQ